MVLQTVCLARGTPLKTLDFDGLTVISTFRVLDYIVKYLRNAAKTIFISPSRIAKELPWSLHDRNTAVAQRSNSTPPTLNMKFNNPPFGVGAGQYAAAIGVRGGIRHPSRRGGGGRGAEICPRSRHGWTVVFQAQTVMAIRCLAPADLSKTDQSLDR